MKRRVEAGVPVGVKANICALEENVPGTRLRLRYSGEAGGPFHLVYAAKGGRRRPCRRYEWVPDVPGTRLRLRYFGEEGGPLHLTSAANGGRRRPCRRYQMGSQCRRKRFLSQKRNEDGSVTLFTS